MSRTQHQELHNRPLRHRALLVTVFALLTLATSATAIIAVPSRTYAANYGHVCNQTQHFTLLVLLSLPATGTQNIGLAPGACTDPNKDADAVWGRDCDASGGNCKYQAWKIGPWSFSVTETYVSPIPPGGLARVEGFCPWDCGWFIDGWWPKPGLSSIGYELQR